MELDLGSLCFILAGSEKHLPSSVQQRNNGLCRGFSLPGQKELLSTALPNNFSSRIMSKSKGHVFIPEPTLSRTNPQLSLEFRRSPLSSEPCGPDLDTRTWTLM